MPPTKQTETITINPKKIAVIVGLVFTLVGGGYATFTTVDDVHSQFATKTEVALQINNVQQEILQVAIMSYEDELMSLNFKISTGQSNDLDAATKENIERRLVDLKTKLNSL